MQPPLGAVLVGQATGAAQQRDIVLVLQEEFKRKTLKHYEAIIPTVRKLIAVWAANKGNLVGKIAALHYPIVDSYGASCAGCSDTSLDYYINWPCDTVQLILEGSNA